MGFEKSGGETHPTIGVNMNDSKVISKSPTFRIDYAHPKVRSKSGIFPQWGASPPLRELVEMMYITNDESRFNRLNPMVQESKKEIAINTNHIPSVTYPPLAPPTPLQINDIINRFFKNTSKKINTESYKERAKQIDKKVKNIHIELHTMIESVYNIPASSIQSLSAI